MTPAVRVGCYLPASGATVLGPGTNIKPMSADTETAADHGLAITERAAQEVTDLLDAEGYAPEEAGLRLYVQQGGCAGLSYGLRFDESPDEEDIIHQEHGIQVFIDPASHRYVQSSTIDFEGGLQGEGFIVDNPNVVSECGCGESFRA